MRGRILSDNDTAGSETDDHTILDHDRPVRLITGAHSLLFHTLCLFDELLVSTAAQ